MGLRIHTVGASGSGTTTLAAALAQELGFPHFDSDDYYWENTDPPFTTKRSVDDRLELLRRDVSSHTNWILSGSLVGWGDSMTTQFTHVIFLYIPPEVRMARLKARERLRFGARIESGGDMEKIHIALMEWAAQYDHGGLGMRSRAMHEEWLRGLACPVIRFEEALSTGAQVDSVLNHLGLVLGE